MLTPENHSNFVACTDETQTLYNRPNLSYNGGIPQRHHLGLLCYSPVGSLLIMSLQ